MMAVSEADESAMKKKRRKLKAKGKEKENTMRGSFFASLCVFVSDRSSPLESILSLSESLITIRSLTPNNIIQHATDSRQDTTVMNRQQRWDEMDDDEGSQSCGSCLLCSGPFFLFSAPPLSFLVAPPSPEQYIVMAPHTYSSLELSVASEQWCKPSQHEFKRKQ